MRDVVIAVVEHDGHFLVGIRPDGTRFAGLAEFPGGKLESGETFVAAAVREVLEETSLLVEPTNLLQEVIDTAVDLRLRFWHCKLATSNSSAKSPFRWVDRSDLATLEFPPANASTVSALLDGDRLL